MKKRIMSSKTEQSFNSKSGEYSSGKDKKMKKSKQDIGLMSYDGESSRSIRYGDTSMSEQENARKQKGK